MEEEIAKLIHEYAKNYKPLDFNFYAEIFKLIVKTRKLIGYVRELHQNFDDKDTAPVSYDSQTGIVEMNYIKLEVYNPEIELYFSMFDEEEAAAFYNAVIVQYLLHSLEHAEQIRRRQTATDNLLETQLMRICGRQYITRSTIEGTNWDYTFRSPIDLRGLETVHRYYSYDPMERLAEIKSFETMVKIMNYLKSEYPNLLEFEQASFIESLLESYPESWEFGLCPTQVYLEGVGLVEDWKNFGFPDDHGAALEKAYDEYSLEDRLRYGLPVYPNEYMTYYEMLEETKKYKYMKRHP